MKKICRYLCLQQKMMGKDRTIAYYQLQSSRWTGFKNIWIRAVFKLGMRKDGDQNKWTRVKIQRTVGINFTSNFILWWKGILRTTAGINPNLSSQYSIKISSGSYWGEWKAVSVGARWGHGAVQLIKGPLGKELKRSSISIAAGLQTMLWFFMFLEHQRSRGRNKGGKESKIGRW